MSNNYKLQYIQNMDKSQKHNAKRKNPNQKTFLHEILEKGKLQ